MSLNWDEKLLSKFYENTKKAILMLNRKVGTLEQQNKTTFEVSEESIRGIVEQYVGDGDETLKKKMAVFQETADGISAIVTKMEKSAIVSVKQRYYLSESHESLIGGEWQDTQPEWVDGKYIWVMSVITQANGEVTYDGAVCITGNTGSAGADGAPGADGLPGADGTPGSDGDGIQSYTAYYKLGSSAAAKPEAPSTSWAATPPEVQKDTYLWVAYLVTYTSGKTEWTEPYCATDAIARGDIKTLSSRIEELAGSITLEVTDGSTTGTASIVLKVDGKEVGSGKIDMSGIVLFKSFLNSTQTKIDGGMVELDTLFAQNIKATGKFQVDNGVWKLEQTDNGFDLGTVCEKTTDTGYKVAYQTLLRVHENNASLVCIEGDDVKGIYVSPSQTTISGIASLDTTEVSGSLTLNKYSAATEFNDKFTSNIPAVFNKKVNINSNLTVTGILSVGTFDIDTLASCPAISEQTVYSTGPSTVSLSAGWKDVKYFKVTPGTYVVSGCIRFSNQAGSSFSTKITTDNGGDCSESLNSVYCSDSAYYSSNSTAIVTISSSDYINLTVYSASAITAYEATLKAVKIHG